MSHLGWPSTFNRRKNVEETPHPYPVVRVVCRSLSPMLQDRFDPSRNHDEQEIIKRCRHDPQALRRLAETKLYRGPNNELGVPFEMLSAALNESMKLFGFTTRKPVIGMPFRDFIPFDPECLHVDWDHPRDERENIREGWSLDIRQSRGGIALRPKFPTWGFTAYCYVLQIDHRRLDEVKRIFTCAGCKCGLGPHRLPFGTFTISTMEPNPKDLL